MDNNSKPIIQYVYCEDDSINFSKFFNIIKKEWKLIITITLGFLFLGLIYIFITKPVYKIKATIEPGYFISNNNQEFFISPQSATTIINTKFYKEDDYPTATAKIQKNTSLIQTSVEAHSNQKAENYLNEIISYLKTKENKKIEVLKQNITSQIQALKKFNKTIDEQLKNLHSQLKNTKDPMLYQTILNAIQKYQEQKNDNNIQISQLKAQLTPLYLQKTKIVGAIEKQDKPAKPKPILIILVSILTGFIVAYIVGYIKYQKSADDSIG